MVFFFITGFTLFDTLSISISKIDYEFTLLSSYLLKCSCTLHTLQLTFNRLRGKKATSRGFLTYEKDATVVLFKKKSNLLFPNRHVNC